MSTSASDHLYDVVIVGVGAAGVGLSVALRHAGIENFVLLERHSVGASFARWPACAGSPACLHTGSAPRGTGCSFVLRQHGYSPTPQRLRLPKVIEVSATLEMKNYFLTQLILVQTKNL